MKKLDKFIQQAQCMGILLVVGALGALFAAHVAGAWFLKVATGS
jgi:hypothetical protein